MLDNLKDLLLTGYKVQVIHRANIADRGRDDAIDSDIGKSQLSEDWNSLSFDELRDSGYTPEDKGNMSVTISLGYCQPPSIGIQFLGFPSAFKLPRGFEVLC
jgi:hypothetical protein